MASSSSRHQLDFIKRGGGEARRAAGAPSALPPPAPLPPNTFSWTDGRTDVRRTATLLPSIAPSLFPIAFFSDTLFHSGKEERLDNSKHDAAERQRRAGEAD